MFDKILIANRGEIAVRIIRAARSLGVKTVAVYSDVDRRAPHVRFADEAVHIGPAVAAESYLVVDKIIAAAKETGAQAVHPGYGFLAENAGFARACADAGLTFIGPSPEAIELMGDKVSARRKMEAAGVPVVPGVTDPVPDAKQAAVVAEQVGYPVMLKAAAGGGGKGLRVVRDPAAVEESFLRASSEAQAAFGDGRMFVERFFEEPHHVEVQVFGDSHGNVVHLFERDCSVQRRHQKVIEETPSPFITDEVRTAICEMAVKAAQAVDYVNAGTVECLVDEKQNFYFLEMNTRLQVEHPITEEVVGIDLAAAQLRVAAGEALPFTQADLSQRGHSIECRIYAEDPDNGFLPFPGPVRHLHFPQGPGVRVDSGVESGFEVPMEYDPMIAKLIVRGADRNEAIDRMLLALAEFSIGGPKTNADYLSRILRHEKFREGDYSTKFIEMYMADSAATTPGDDELLLAAMAVWHEKKRKNGAVAGGGVAESNWKLSGRIAGLRS